MEIISLELAKELSLIKWNAIYNEEQPEFPEEWKEALEENFNCGFCLRHNLSKSFENERVCDKCEFGKIAGKCKEENSLYQKWLDFSENDTMVADYLASEIIKKIEQL